MFKQFPDHFMWGAATSAIQSEGASSQGGKSQTTWDAWFSMQPERFNQGQGPEVTSDVYHQYKDEAKRMAAIGLNSYRTSISWARLLPDGKSLNPEAVRFYRDYFEALLAQGITPIINLFHFDMPWWLMQKGGWEVRESVDHFAYYAQVAFEQFGDLVKHWTTFNEPMVHIECGYLGDAHYPMKHDFKLAVQVGYHTLMAHVMAVKAFREANIQGGTIGIILNVSPAYAKSDSESDQHAKQCADNLYIFSFLDSVVLGQVPAFLVDLLARNQLLPTTEPQDSDLIARYTVDFVGMNYYQPFRVQAPKAPVFPAQSPSAFFSGYDMPGKRMNEYRGWEIYPEALYDVAMMMKDKYGNIPWYVSENGMGVAEEERFSNAQGEIQDDYRIAFMKEHLEQLHKGIQAGSNCFGYHTWTFSDCWSWLNGYRNRYGFYRVAIDDHCKRTLKKSGRWYKQMIEDKGFE